MNVNDEQLAMLRQPFRFRHDRRELVGVEIEAGVVDPATGLPRRYRSAIGEPCVESLIGAIGEAWGGHLYFDGEHSIGVKCGDGTEIGLESGCALEYVSTPEPDLATLASKVNRHMSQLAAIADRHGSALLSGSKPADF